MKTDLYSAHVVHADETGVRALGEQHGYIMFPTRCTPTSMSAKSAGRMA